MTLTELAAIVGQSRYFVCPMNSGTMLRVPVKVLDVAMAYGTPLITITPIGGAGTARVRIDSLEVMP